MIHTKPIKCIPTCTCIVPVDIVVNVKIIEELSLMKNGVLKSMNSELSKSEVDELLQNICCE